MKRLVYLLMVFLYCNCDAQLKRYSFELSVNYPWVAELSKKPQVNASSLSPASGYSSIYANVGTLKEEYSGMPGIGFSSSFQVYQSKNFFIEIGLGCQLYRYKKIVRIEIADPIITPSQITRPGQPYTMIYGSVQNDSTDIVLIGNSGFQTSDNIGKASTLYLQFPILAGKSFYKDKLSVKAGGSFNLLILSRQTKEGYSFQTGISEYIDKSRAEFTPVIFNAQAQITYHATKQLGISFTYQRSVNPIYKESLVDKSYYNLFSLSMGYNIHPN